jgi:hypothetical protein
MPSTRPIHVPLDLHRALRLLAIVSGQTEGEVVYHLCFPLIRDESHRQIAKLHAAMGPVVSSVRPEPGHLPVRTTLPSDRSRAGTLRTGRVPRPRGGT